MQRPDGYSMVGGYVQGARTYDPTGGQWLTPDPYAGNVHDPMSQKPFMWNDNNPVQWTDPSGYDTIQAIARPVLTGIWERLIFNAEHTFIRVKLDARSGQKASTTNITFGPVDGRLRQVPSNTENGRTGSAVTLCQGNCSSQAMTMEKAASQIDQERQVYGGVTSNSNSGSAGVVEANGGNLSGMFPSGTFVPGLNQPVTVPSDAVPKPQPAPPPQSPNRP